MPVQAHTITTPHTHDLQSLSFPSANVAEVTVTYKRTFTKVFLPQITTSSDAYDIFMQIWDKDNIDYCERMYALFLDGSNRIFAWSLISEGGTTRTNGYPYKLFTLALLANATSIILGHNHPSGNKEPSRSDFAYTTRILEGAQLLGLKLLDHLIVTRCHGFTSIQGLGHL